jgi:hypothetical protein
MYDAVEDTFDLLVEEYLTLDGDKSLKLISPVICCWLL